MVVMGFYAAAQAICVGIARGRECVAWQFVAADGAQLCWGQDGVCGNPGFDQGVERCAVD